MWYLIADTWTEIFNNWSQLFSDPRVKNAAEAIAAYVAGLTALIGVIGWAWKKILIPLGKAASNVSDMYSTHEYMLTEVTKIKDAVALIQQVSDNCRQNGEELRELVRQSTMAAEASIVKTRLLYEDSSSSSARYECNLKGELIWSNAAMQKLFGMHGEDMLKDGWLAGLHPDDIKKTAREWQETVKDWVPYIARYRIIHPTTGKEIPVEASAEIVRDFRGNIVCIWGRVTRLDGKRMSKMNVSAT